MRVLLSSVTTIILGLLCVASLGAWLLAGTQPQIDMSVRVALLIGVALQVLLLFTGWWQWERRAHKNLLPTRSQRAIVALQILLLPVLIILSSISETL